MITLPVLTFITLTVDTLRTCDETKWSCHDGRRCINKKYVCGKIFHCTDGSDEKHEVCALWQCTNGKWKCGNNKCIDKEKVCDGYDNIISDNCGDGSDEAQEVCSTWNCTTGLWKCANYKCIANVEVCDGRTDHCGDGSDEHLETCQEWKCSTGYWKCDNMKCIQERRVCDGNSYSISGDCKDGSDEAHCDKWICPLGYWKCDDMVCVEENNVCDGELGRALGGCRDGSDEAYCKEWVCPKGKWKCDDMLCIDEIRVCDGSDMWGCLDGSDEAHCEDYICSEARWKCLDGVTCEPMHNVCDGFTHHCPDNSDEDPSLCHDWTCLPGYWKCHDNSECILTHGNILDGDWDCKDGSDEIAEYHIKSSCREGYQLCNDSIECVKTQYWCDGKYSSPYLRMYGCLDQSDEGLYCEYWQCLDDFWKCADNLKCIATKYVCDGRYDCNDKSDEHNSLCVCKGEDWPCQDGDGCVKNIEVCDGIPHCNDKSDEYESVCLSWNCTNQKTKCNGNRRCVFLSDVCDGTEDCLDGSDEQECELHPWVDGRSKCADEMQCIHKDNICDGIMHCRDGSDELCTSSCTEPAINSRSIMRRCSEDVSKCFPVERYCDGVADCPFGSDEADSGCSCEDWDMVNFRVSSSGLCIYKEWSTTIMNRTSKYNLSYFGLLGSSDTTVWNPRMHITLTDSNASNIIIDIDLENITFLLHNGNFIFVNCLFKGLSIIGSPKNCKRNCHLEIAVQNCVFKCPSAEKNCTNIIRYDKGSIVKIAMFESMFHYVRLDIFAHSLMFTVNKCSFLDMLVQIKVRSYVRVPSLVLMEHTSFSNSFQGMMLDLYNPFVILTNCSFTGTSVEIFSRKLYYQHDLLYINIFQSVFKRGFKDGNGGGLLIFSEAKWSSVELFYVAFHDNKLWASNGHTGKGGALFVHGIVLDLAMTDCAFVNNSSPREGTAVFLSEGVSATITNTSFELKIDNQFPTPIVTARGKVNNLSSTVKVRNSFPNLYSRHIHILNTHNILNSLIISVECPSFYTHLVDYQLESSGTVVNQANKSIITLKDFIYRCGVCTERYYSISAKQNILSFNNEMANVQETTEAKRGCITCPYGAVCSGNNVVPRPNYWGYWHGGELVFQQCPAGYCCSDNTNEQCKEYNWCSGNRTGVLCGVCKKNFAVSIVSGKCISETQCKGTQWFWLLMILATLGYVLWYTCKDLLFQLAFCCLLKLKTICLWRKHQNVVSGKQLSPHGNETALSQSSKAQPVTITDSHVDKDSEIEEDTGYFGIIAYFIHPEK